MFFLFINTEPVIKAEPIPIKDKVATEPVAGNLLPTLFTTVTLSEPSLTSVSKVKVSSLKIPPQKSLTFAVASNLIKVLSVAQSPLT